MQVPWGSGLLWLAVKHVPGGTARTEPFAIPWPCVRLVPTIFTCAVRASMYSFCGDVPSRIRRARVACFRSRPVQYGSPTVLC